MSSIESDDKSAKPWHLSLDAVHTDEFIAQLRAQQESLDCGALSAFETVTPLSSPRTPCFDLTYTHAATDPPPQLAQHVPTKIVKPVVRRSLCGMYRWLPWQDKLMLLLPALLISVATGGLPVGMTHVIGRAFGAFTAYDKSQPGANEVLRSSVLTDIYVLLGLAGGTLVLRASSTALWLVVGEHGARGWRTYVSRQLFLKEADWYDLGMGLQSADTGKDAGAAGIMALFLRDTDEVRMAMGSQMGYLLLHAASMLASAVYALTRSWKLALVIFAALPLVAIATVVGEMLGAPMLAAERIESVQLAALVEKTTSAIKTLKAFHAENMQRAALDACIERCRALYKRVCVVWGVRFGIVSTLALMTFVQGFGYGSHLVRTHKTGPDVVLSTFLASLMAMGQLQGILQRLHFLETGKHSAANLDAVARSQPVAPAADNDEHGTQEKSHDIEMAPRLCITPDSCRGEMSLDRVWYAYPTRPSVPVLCGISMHFSPGELTFVVGRSGSGKSTVVELLLKLRAPQLGSVALDGQALATLDTAWFRAQVRGLVQDPLILEKSMYDNIAMGCTSSISVREAAWAARLDDVLQLLPEGFATVLGQRGTTLSRGQKQRVALARAFLQHPPVLILDEATSALDTESAAAVMETLRIWRHGQTTIIITHHIAHIRPADFCYILEQGQILEQGAAGDLAHPWFAEAKSARLLTSPLEKEPVSGSIWSMASEKTHISVSPMHTLTDTAPEPAKLGDRAPILAALGILARTVPQKSWLLLLLCCCILSGLTTPVFAFCLTQVMMGIANPNAQSVGMWIGATAGLAVADGVLKGVRLIGMEAIGARWIAALRREAVRQLLVQDCAWYDAPQNTPSALTTQVVRDAEDARVCLGNLVGQAVTLCAMILGTLIWSFVLGWQLTLCMLALLPIVVGLYGTQGYFASSTERKSKAMRENMATLLYDRVRSIQAERAMETAMHAETLAAAIDAAAKAGRRAAYVVALGAGLAEAITYAAEAFLYGIGAVLLMNGTYDLHRFMLVLNPLIFAVGFAAQLGTSFTATSKAVLGLCATDRLLRLSQHGSDRHGEATPSVRGEIAFTDVGFQYGRHGPAPLRNVSFTVHAGEHVALVGKSGAGKSTLGALLLRLYEPDQGTICLSGHAIRSMDPVWLRAQIASVGQDVCLFPATAQENIALGRHATLRAVEAAATRAGAHAFLSALPEKYATMLGNATTRLSGGEAQRLGIARALLRTEAHILLLDEFTAALDHATRAQVADVVLGQRDKTILLVSHDEALIRRCDRVVVLEQGAIVEQGAPRELLGKADSRLRTLLMVGAA
ncbi:ABC-type xenobiotic transporter [Malassezia vespertilionis]|uniref:Ste6p n=1 Tax=Malassezia vespertilionis TaxID=2020962 RepID=A0A2N1JH93_9BASI|nr:ABC-type xenobiotic transporter [Malassezia vespertilionis]PKI85930.1 hypothetical protein MVES_000169 [Malassezia vespertilionis]WFD04849.1 ABC-type xenobiotic transporter [Malassezia vespertilionis]